MNRNGNMYTDLTDEEYDALDEELSHTIPKFGPPGSDWLVQRECANWDWLNSPRTIF
jgi:hypothetical protein